MGEDSVQSQQSTLLCSLYWHLNTQAQCLSCAHVQSNLTILLLKKLSLMPDLMFFYNQLCDHHTEDYIFISVLQWATQLSVLSGQPMIRQVLKYLE